MPKNIVKYQTIIANIQFQRFRNFSHGDSNSILHGSLHISQCDGSLEYLVTHVLRHLRCTSPCVPSHAHAFNKVPFES